MDIRTARLLDAIKESRKEENRKEWELLRERVFSDHTDKEILKLKDDFNAFMDSDAPDEEKTKLRMYAEPLAMLVAAVGKQNRGSR